MTNGINKTILLLRSYHYLGPFTFFLFPLALVSTFVCVSSSTSRLTTLWALRVDMTGGGDLTCGTWTAGAPPPRAAPSPCCWWCRSLPASRCPTKLCSMSRVTPRATCTCHMLQYPRVMLFGLNSAFALLLTITITQWIFCIRSNILKFHIKQFVKHFNI